VNVEANSLHEAVAKAVQVFRNKPAPIKSRDRQPTPALCNLLSRVVTRHFELLLRRVVRRVVLPLPIVEYFAFPIYAVPSDGP